jgi:two-component system OmpR family sensor kinase
VKASRGRLALRIYVYSVLSVLAVVVLSVGLGRLMAQPWRGEVTAFVREVSTRLLAGDRAELAARAEVLAEASHIGMTIYERDGRLIVNAARPAPAPLDAAELAALDHDGALDRSDEQQVRTIADGSGRYVIVSLPERRIPRSLWISLSLAVVLLLGTSLVFARSLTRPLTRLADAARRFGAGKTDARVGLRRADEIGQAGAAFDQMAEQVTSLMRAQRELLANISHELRTPMARMRVALDLAAEGEPAAARELLGEIDQDLGELERLLDDVLTTSRLELTGSAAPPLRREPVVVRELLGQSVDRFRTRAPSHPLTLAGEIDATVDADPALLRRVFDNVLDNARKYSPAGSTIDLSSRLERDQVHVEIADRGQGISPADLPRLFTPFFRADPSRTRSSGGVGLGLALAKRIVDAHGGAIWVESQEGQGTRVHVTLPVIAPQGGRSEAAG